MQERICNIHNEPKVIWANKYKCKSCNREYQRKWFALNRDLQGKRTRINTDKYIERNNQYIFEYLKLHPCVDCKESDPVVLTFDHKDQKDKVSNISKLVSRCATIEKIQEEIDKCEVRCANCHIRRTSKQLNWKRSSWI